MVKTTPHTSNCRVSHMVINFSLVYRTLKLFPYRELTHCNLNKFILFS